LGIEFNIDVVRRAVAIVFSSSRLLPVLEFDRGPRPRNFLSRREQWRLLFLVLMLGVVVILALEARKPEHYQWLLALDERGGGSAEGGVAPDDRPIDTRVPPERESQEIPGTFLSPAPPKPDEATPSRRFPGVRPSLLRSVRDDRLLGPSEWDAWMHLFQVLEESDEAALAEASTGPVSFVQLFEQSSEYRGELVTTRGTIRRAHRTKTPRNDYGLSEYYDTWLQPADHPTDPIVVWCLHLPEGFPTGMEVAEEVEVTGFFFKLLAYKAADGKILRAPLLLARTLHWRKPPEEAKTPPRGPWPLVLMIAGAALFALLATRYVYSRTGKGETSRLESLVRKGMSRDLENESDVGAALERLTDSETAGEMNDE
jgi:hypothetical protein